MAKKSFHRYPRLDRQSMLTILANQKALMVHQLTLVDLLNSIENGRELSRELVKDDPNKDGYGNGLGLKVANRIIAKRDQLNGFTSLTDLIDIPYFGIDKFNDLIYTYVNHYLPIPTLLGAEFDRLLMSLSRLEIFAKREGLSGNQFIGLLHTIYQTEKLDGGDFEFSEQLEESATKINGTWLENANFSEDMSIIKASKEISIGKNQTNFQHFIATLYAKLSNNNTNRIAFESRLGRATSMYLSQEDINNESEILHTDVDVYHFETMSQSHYHGMADALAMKYEPSSSFIWNLLNYYTKKRDKSFNKFKTAAVSIGLGNWNASVNSFINDEPDLRVQWQNNIKGLLNEDNPKILSGLNTANVNKQMDEVVIKNTDSFIDMLSALAQAQDDDANLISWNRLESRPRTDDYTRTMFAEIRDPLWMLARQYQFGEFLGEDAGSAIETRVNVKTTKIDTFAGLLDNSASDYNEGEPLEMTVEKTSVNVDLMSRLEMCRWWKRKAKANPDGVSFIEDLCTSTQLAIDEESWNIVVEENGLEAEVKSNPTNASVHQLISNGKYFDGYKLFVFLDSGNSLTDLSSDHGSVFSALASNFISWVNKNYLEVYGANNDSWNKNRLEYSFGCSAPNTGQSTEVFKVEEYANGHLDWYYFKKQKAENHLKLVPNSVDENRIQHTLKTMIPTLMEYPGMPLARWWQLEDYRINFEKLAINRNDTATLAFTEFVTLYSNDWQIVPLNLDAGSICKVKSVVVKDVFGQYTKVETANKNSQDWNCWAIFDISSDENEINNSIIIPPTLVKSQEGKPFEEVNFIRDEMSNMVWSIETKISNQLLGFKDAFEASLERNNINDRVDEINLPDDLDESVKIAYRLGSTVPENWIPFIPSLVDQDTNEIQFLRGSMPRPKPDGTAGYERIRPMTSLLRVNLDDDIQRRYFIHEEEIPKSGAIVSRNWQRTRWYNGKVCWWAANKKVIGKGQGSSGLKWDVIEEINT
jgi:hypothetical protein